MGTPLAVRLEGIFFFRFKRAKLGPTSVFGDSFRSRFYSPFLGALQYKFMVTRHKLELGSPLAHPLQALPH